MTNENDILKELSMLNQKIDIMLKLIAIMQYDTCTMGMRMYRNNTSDYLDNRCENYNVMEQELENIKEGQNNE